MISFLFWNTNGRELGNLIPDLVADHDVDVIILAEARTMRHAPLLEALNSAGRRYTFHTSPNDKIRIYSRFSEKAIVPLHDAGGVSIRRLTRHRREEIILVAAHLPSKLHWTTDDQPQLAARVAGYIRDVQRARGHARTIVVGDINDINMNPFDAGVVSSEGFHAVMSRRVAGRRTRRVHGEDRLLFYNPMWSWYGDHGGRVPGTYYYAKSVPVAYFWHMFDQVLISSDLVSAFRRTAYTSSPRLGKSHS